MVRSTDQRQTLLSRRRLLMGAAATAGAAVLAACGGSNTATNTPAAKPTTAASPAAAANSSTGAASVPTTAAPAATTAAAPATAATSGSPVAAVSPATTGAATTSASASSSLPGKKGGKLVWALESDPVNLIPYGGVSTSNMWGKEFIYDSLLAWDKDLNVIPALAESYDQPDATSYVFHLRKGVKFHDGKELDAEDVKYSFDMMKAPRRPASSGSGSPTLALRSWTSTPRN